MINKDMGILFLDYNFRLLPDGSIEMDKELLPSKIKVSSGDKFEVVIAESGSVVLKKIN